MSNKKYSQAIAAQIRGIIAQKGLSRAEISERTGIPSRTLARYLNETPQLTLDTAKVLADAIEVRLGDILDAADKALDD